MSAFWLGLLAGWLGTIAMIGLVLWMLSRLRWGEPLSADEHENGFIGGSCRKQEPPR